MRYVEVEKKFELSDPAPLIARPASLGAKPGPPVRQVDAYCNAPHRDFLVPSVVSEWLRIRVAGEGGSVNFKRFHPVHAVAKTHADEFETAVGDVEVAIDRVVGAGDFVEFEFTARRPAWRTPPGDWTGASRRSASHSARRSRGGTRTCCSAASTEAVGRFE